MMDKRTCPSYRTAAQLIIILCLIRGEFRQSGATAYCRIRRHCQDFALVSSALLAAHFELDKKYKIYNRKHMPFKKWKLLLIFMYRHLNPLELNLAT